MSVIIVFLAIYCSSTQAWTIASYNTHQSSFISPNQLTEQQISEIKEADFDLICLQELTSIPTALQYEKALKNKKTAYKYAYSELDAYDFSARAPCSTDQANLFQSGCIADNCGSDSIRLNPNAFTECVARQCQSQFFDLIYTECFYCISLCSTFPDQAMCASNIDLAATAELCTNELSFQTDLLSGTAIYTHHRIVNTWTIDIPSWLVQRSLILAEIGVCCGTQPGIKAQYLGLLDADVKAKGKCRDTIIVGCLHLKDNDMADPVGTFYPTTQEQIDQGITSNVELNAYQSSWILENILDPENAPWMHDGYENNVKQVFILGDYNVGELLNSENLGMWYSDGFVNAKRIDGIENVDEGGTYNANLNSELPNSLAQQASVFNDWVLFDRDLDQILVYNGNEYDIDNGGGNGGDNENSVSCLDAVSFNRVFTETFNVEGTPTELSDHWGVSFDFNFLC